MAGPLSYRTIDPSELEGREPYYLLTSLVVPRPIAWVSTLSPQGVVNLAPHSYFNIISSDPWIVHFTSTGEKDTLRNVRASGEFVVNIVDKELAKKMNATSSELPPDTSELEAAGLEAVPSVRVSPPRVGSTPAALECKLNDIVSKGNGHMVFGEVVALHIDERVLSDGRVDPARLRPVGRLGGSFYTDAAGALFELRRPPR